MLRRQTTDTMLSFQDQLESLMSTQTVDCETLPTFPDAFAWPTDRAQHVTYSNNAQPTTQPPMNDVGRKRGSKALVFICPETNEPIEHYRSDQSSSSARSTSSEEIKSKASGDVSVFVSEAPASRPLPQGSKLHRWMAMRKAEETSVLCCDVPMGLYYHGSSNIWNSEGLAGVQDLSVGELTLSGILNNDVKKEDPSTQGVPKSSRLWTWIGDQESAEEYNTGKKEL